MGTLSGWILIDKNKGVSSRKIVNFISNQICSRKVGHAGTLDPLASGLLCVAIGQATKTISIIQNMKKIYKFSLRWGFSTTTDDSEGEKMQVSHFRPSVDQILKKIPNFLGKIEQVPPKYSAIKINGKRSYSLARENKTFSLQSRAIEIFNFKHLKSDNIDTAEFRIICSKGTYVRSIARDLGEALGTKAHVVNIRREKIGNFSVKDAILLDLSEKLIHSPLISNNLIPIGSILKNLPTLNLTENEANKIKNGQKLKINVMKYAKIFLKHSNHKSHQEIYCRLNEIPIALSYIQGDILTPRKVFNL